MDIPSVDGGADDIVQTMEHVLNLWIVTFHLPRTTTLELAGTVTLVHIQGLSALAKTLKMSVSFFKFNIMVDFWNMI